MAGTSKRAILVQSVLTKLNESIISIVVEHIKAECITSFQVTPTWFNAFPKNNPRTNSRG